MLAPALIWFALFMYQPMWGLQIAFKQFSVFKGIEGSPWVGFEHFATLFENSQFHRAIWNTLVISFYSLILASPVPILLALMINEVQSKGLRKTVQTVVYLPHFISVVIVAGIVIAVLSPTTGLVNNALASLGFDRIYFLTRPEWFRSIYIALEHLEGGRLRFDHLPGRHHGHQPGAVRVGAGRRRHTLADDLAHHASPASCRPSRCCW